MVMIIAIAKRTASSFLVAITAPVWLPLAFVVGLVGRGMGMHRAD